MPKLIDNPMQIIMEEARSILEKEGYEKLSIRKIAKGCGIATGTIYNYFPTKRHLVLKIMMDFWEEYLVAFEEIDQRERAFYKKLRAMYQKFEIFVNTFHETWVKMNSGMAMEYSEDGKRGRENFTERLIKRMEMIIKRETLKNADIKLGCLEPKETARFIIMNFIMITQTKQYDYDSFEKIIQKVLK